MDKVAYIYALIDPLTMQVRYVGKTTNLDHRLIAHVSTTQTTNVHKKRWIEKLKKQGLRPNIQVLEETSLDTWPEREQYWISYYRAHTADLLNLNEGGKGGMDEVNEETRAKMSQSHKRRYQENPEQLEQARSTLRRVDRTNPALRAKIAAAHLARSARGERMSDEARAKIAASRRGSKRGPLSEEHKAKIAAAHKGKKKPPFSEEHKAKIAEAGRGKPVSDETRRKLSISSRGRPHSEEARAKISAARKANPTKPNPNCPKCRAFLRNDGTCAACEKRSL